jgi:Lhr-like helicase
MIIQEHIKSLTFILIIKLEQQTLILEKSWMRKHEINYHEKTNIIEFFSEFCTHSRRIKNEDDVIVEQRKKYFFREEIFFKSIRSLEIWWLDQELEKKDRH